jgi:hypothetical protein
VRNGLFDERTNGGGGLTGFRPGSEGPFRWRTDTFRDCLLAAVSDPAVPVFAVVLAVAACLGGWAEALCIFLALCAGVAVNALLRYRAGAVFSAMNSGLVAPVRIERDGEERTVRFFDVCEGDVLVLAPGTVVPADAELVSGDRLRVLEQYYDYEKGMKAARKVDKYISGTDFGEAPGLTDPNIVLAGSTVLTGRARASVRAVGADTQISRRLGGIKVAPSERRTPSLRALVSACGTCSVVMMTAGIPLLLLYLVLFRNNGETGVPIISMAAVFLALLFAAPGGRDSAIYDYISAREFAQLSGIRRNGRLPEDPAACLYIPSLADDIRRADTVIMLDRSVVGDLNSEVRSVFFDSKDYSGELVGSGDLTPFSEKALLLRAVHMTGGSADETDAAFDSFATMQKTDRDFILRDVSAIKPRIGYPGDGDVSASVTYKGELPETFLLTRTFSRDVVRHCRFFRRYDGSLGSCDLAFSDRMAKWLDVTDGRCLTPVFVTACRSDSDILILEGAAAVGGTFPDFNSEVVSAMSEIGLRPVLVLPDDSPASVTAARMCGIAADASEIAVAAEYRRTGRELADGFDKIRVFTGFGASGTEKILSMLKEKSTGIISVVSDAGALRSLKAGTVTLASGGAPGSVNIACAGCVCPASEHSPSSGVASVFSLCLSAVNSSLKISLLRTLMLFRAVFLISLVLLPLVTGNYYLVPGAFALCACTVFSTASFVFGTAADRFLPASLASLPDPSDRRTGLRSDLLTGAMAFLSAIAVTVTGALASSGGREDLPAFVMFAPVFVLVAAQTGFRAERRRSCGLSGINPVAAAAAGLAVLWFALCCFLPAPFPFLVSMTGAGAASVRLVWLSAIPALLSGLMVWASGFIPLRASDKGFGSRKL